MQSASQRSLRLGSPPSDPAASEARTRSGVRCGFICHAQLLLVVCAGTSRRKKYAHTYSIQAHTPRSGRSTYAKLSPPTLLLLPNRNLGGYWQSPTSTWAPPTALIKCLDKYAKQPIVDCERRCLDVGSNAEASRLYDHYVRSRYVIERAPLSSLTPCATRGRGTTRCRALYRRGDDLGGAVSCGLHPAEQITSMARDGRSAMTPATTSIHSASRDGQRGRIITASPSSSPARRCHIGMLLESPSSAFVSRRDGRSVHFPLGPGAGRGAIRHLFLPQQPCVVRGWACRCVRAYLLLLL
ncbi:hypothetical protein JDV02_008118 [Purpureocillium takamizusanense]|uniref:Uncharacterized protein n=1 Tax=Purpureocillium takamizusanense TaxID=2060973 RepID=A0A9Q8QJJ7_9HYPO|nr:uncharacterized protein JDV02_008118 [Purpureocillium takamizusanense]UNI22209.1 hypothetical protein JDV02_008118 [Purpureocillium takamizusanense]